MKKTAKKPSGFNEFDTLLKKLVKVPKSELDQRLAARVVRKRKK